MRSSEFILFLDQIILYICTMSCYPKFADVYFHKGQLVKVTIITISLAEINTASSEKGTTLKVANSEFQFFGYYVMGPYE